MTESCGLGTRLEVKPEVIKGLASLDLVGRGCYIGKEATVGLNLQRIQKLHMKAHIFRSPEAELVSFRGSISNTSHIGSNRKVSKEHWEASEIRKSDSYQMQRCISFGKRAPGEGVFGGVKHPSTSASRFKIDTYTADTNAP